jgi:hypothetical protein
MNISPESYAEVCKQLAFISALVAGFSFAFISVLLTSDSKHRIIDWVIGFSISSIAGFLVCSLTWTLSASRMALYSANKMNEIPVLYFRMHRILSFIFILSYFLFCITLGLSGWIRSRKLGVISSIISLFAGGFFLWLMSSFKY